MLDILRKNVLWGQCPLENLNPGMVNFPSWFLTFLIKIDIFAWSNKEIVIRAL